MTVLRKVCRADLHNLLFAFRQHTSLNLMCVCPCIVVISEEENQLDVTQCFIELVICSTCFGHVYANHEELATLLLVWHVACSSWLLVVGRSDAGQQAMRPGRGMLYDFVVHLTFRPPATKNYTPHAIPAIKLRAPHDWHKRSRNMLSRLQVQ